MPSPLSNAESGFQRKARVLALLVAFFQLLTLNAVALNGDEALYMLLGEEIQRVFSGQGLTLHPIIDYSGPLDFWAMGAFYFIAGKIFSGFGQAWMVRIVPLIVFWISLISLFREVRRWSSSLAHWMLLVASLTPMVLVYSRSAFPHGLLLGIFFALLAESLRIQRCGKVHWLRIAVLGGLATETNTTAFLGLLAVFAPVASIVLARVRADWPKASVSALIFGAFALPVLSQFPPPIHAPGEGGGSWALELRNFLNMLSGQQPLYWLLHEEIAPVAAQLSFLILLLSALLMRGWSIFRTERARAFARDAGVPLRVALRGHWISLLLASAFLLVMCQRGRSLRLVGHERYFLILVPGWILLQADAFQSLFHWAFRRWSKKVAITGAVLAGGFLLARFAIPVVRFSLETDPSLLSAQWLSEECPRERCLGYAENFWNYWPIRYYSRDSIDLNYTDYNWKAQPKIPRNDRELAVCQFIKTSQPYTGPYSKRAIFSAQSGGEGQVCYLGVISEKEKPQGAQATWGF